MKTTTQPTWFFHMKTCSCCINSSVKMKKSLWSPQEDEKLLAYVNQFGAKKWNDVPLQTGLERCGKSCRLRWLNYLRPDLKRGKFSPLERKLIFELQSIYGNRWSRIAKQLPGRTDNDIKNFWNNAIHKGANRRKRQFYLDLDQITSYRRAVPFNIEFDLPNLEDAVQVQQENLTTEECSANSSSSSQRRDSNVESSPYDFLLEPFCDASLQDLCSIISTVVASLQSTDE